MVELMVTTARVSGFESSAGDLSSEVVNSLNYSATDLSDLSD